VVFDHQDLNENQADSLNDQRNGQGQGQLRQKSGLRPGRPPQEGLWLRSRCWVANNPRGGLSAPDQETLSALLNPGM
jgi:hypothetical protein